MRLSRIILPILLVAFVTLSLYLLIALPLLQDPDSRSKQHKTSTSDHAYTDSANNTGTHSVTAEKTSSTAPTANRSDSNIGYRLFEVFGTITDSLGQPVEDALITEERYFSSATSDEQGNYRIRLDLPPNRLPTLNFLRAGFAGKRIKLTQSQLQQKPIFKLDTTLIDSTETLRISGWVASDIGGALEGVRIEINALGSSESENFYLTVFSDERGNFVLEGARATTHYRLTAILAPEYPIYIDDDFYLGSEPEQLQIQLRSLKFVNLGGMMMNSEAAPVTDFEIYINNLSTGVHTGKIVSDSSGFFTLDHFPLGEVSLSTRGADFYKISGLELTELNYTNLRLIVDRGNRHLSGWVSDENGLAINKALITLESTITEGKVEYFSYRSRSTDDSGRFSFGKVARGDYRISAFANGFEKLTITHKLRSPSDQLQLTLTRPP
jgi:Carboxypeptidase regulatory-like domain